MKIKNIFLTIALMLVGFGFAFAQTTQTREVVPGGGGSSTGGTYTNFSVVGEPVVGQEASGTYSGSTHGFLAEFGVNGAPTAPAVTETYDGLEASPLTVSGLSGAIFRWYSDPELTNLVHTGSSYSHGKINTGVYTYYVTQDLEGIISDPAPSVLTINKAVITVTADNKNKQFGTSDPAFTVQYSGFVNGETVTKLNGTPILSRDPGEALGNYTITPTIGTLHAQNYSFQFTNGTFTIIQANVEFTLSNNAKTYSGLPQSATITNDKTLVLNTDYTISGNVQTDAGTYPLVITLLNANYNMTSASAIGNLVIDKAELSATADNKSKCINTPNPELTITYSGFVNGETKTVITEPSINTLAELNSPANSYDITLSGGTAANYNLSLHNGTLVVHALPVPTISGLQAISTDAQLVLATQSGMSGYSWTVDGASVNGADNEYEIALSWATSGTKTVAVTYTDLNGCTGTSASFEVVVTTGCTAISIVTQPQAQTVCLGSPATFTVAASGTSPVYAWYKSGSSTVLSTTNSLTIPNAQLTDNGNYYVVIDNDCTTDPGIQSNSVALQVNAPVTPTVSITAPGVSSNALAITQGTSVTFTATPANLAGGTASYQWKVNGGNVGTNQNTYTTSALTNGQTVSCDISLVGGCVSTQAASSNSIAVQVYSAPANPATIAYVNRSITSLTYNVTKPVGADGVILVVYKNTNSTPVNQNQYTANSSYPSATLLGGDARVVLNFSNMDRVNSQVINIEVSGLTRNTTYKAVAYAYNWDGTNAATTVYGAVSNLLSNATSRKEGVEIEEPLMTSHFEVCRVNPNPVIGEINYCIDAYEDSDFTIEIFTAAGELVLSENPFLKAGVNSMRIDLASYKGGIAAGTYFLKVSSRGEALTQQIVVLP